MDDRFMRFLVRHFPVGIATLLLTIAAVLLSVAVTAVIMILFMGGPNQTGLVIGIAIPLIITPYFTYTFLQTFAELESARHKLQELADTDALTKVFNRRYFMDQLSEMWSDTQRTGINFSVLIIDLDNFKNINDTYGHAVGDAVLQHVARLSMEHVRRTDLFARYGGEEFAVLLPKSSEQIAREVAERLRDALAEQPYQGPSGPITMTASMGVASSSRELDSPDALLIKADRALYTAKVLGKDQVIIAPRAVS